MRLIALAQAQLQDVVRNAVFAFFAGILPVMGLIMRWTMPESVQPILLTMLLLMAAYFVGWNLPSFTLAEEKEKRQLEALFLTPVRPWQVVLVKGALGVAATAAVGGLVLLIFGQMPARPLLWLFSYLLLALFTVAGGTLVGLLVRDMRTMAIGGTPVQLLLLFASTLPWALAEPGVWAAQAWMPTRPAVELLQAGLFGDEAPVLRHALVMLAYTGLLWVASARLIRRLSFLGR